MPLVKESPLLDELFASSRNVLGDDYGGYRNHCYRVLNFALGLTPAEGDARTRLEIACFFHDFGIWADATFDYLGPSAARALAYLRSTGRLDWSEEVQRMVTEHHRITSAAAHGPQVEAFRRADWADVSLAVLRRGLPRGLVTEVRRAFPNRGFHRRLVTLTIARARRHPLSPLPMIKW
jgi:hypothetical protein